MTLQLDLASVAALPGAVLVVGQGAVSVTCEWTYKLLDERFELSLNEERSNPILHSYLVLC